MSAQFAVVIHAILVGHTRFENADPPMGCVYGTMDPTHNLSDLRHRHAALPDSLPSGTQAGFDWPSPTILTPDGAELACSGAALFEHVDADGIAHFEVEAVGIDAHAFSHHFAHHIRAYQERF